MTPLASIWQRIQYDHWQEAMPLIGFCIFFTLFLIVVVMTLRMRKDKIDHLSNLPLEDNPSQKHSENDARPKE